MLLGLLGVLATIPATLIASWLTMEWQVASRSRNLKRLEGTWESAYVGVYELPGEIIKERVEFGRYRLKFRPNRWIMRSRTPSSGVPWMTTTLKLLKGRQIVGEWASQSGDSAGAFLLTWTSEQDMMCGWWFGSRADNAVRFSRWVLYKEPPRSMGEAFNHLASIEQQPNQPLPSVATSAS